MVGCILMTIMNWRKGEKMEVGIIIFTYQPTIATTDPCGEAILMWLDAFLVGGGYCNNKDKDFSPGGSSIGGPER